MPAQPTAPAAWPRSNARSPRRRATRTSSRAASRPPATAIMPGASSATGLGRVPRSLTSCTAPAIARTTTTPSTRPARRPARRGGTRRSSSDTGRRNTARLEIAATTSPPATVAMTVSSTDQVTTTCVPGRKGPRRRSPYGEVAEHRAERRGDEQQQEDLGQPEAAGLPGGETTQLGQAELGRAFLGGRPDDQVERPPAQQHELGDGQWCGDPDELAAVVGPPQRCGQLRVDVELVERRLVRQRADLVPQRRSVVQADLGGQHRDVHVVRRDASELRAAGTDEGRVGDRRVLAVGADRCGLRVEHREVRPAGPVRRLDRHRVEGADDAHRQRGLDAAADHGRRIRQRDRGPVAELEAEQRHAAPGHQCLGAVRGASAGGERHMGAESGALDDLTVDLAALERSGRGCVLPLAGVGEAWCPERRVAQHLVHEADGERTVAGVVEPDDGADRRQRELHREAEGVGPAQGVPDDRLLGRPGVERRDDRRSAGHRGEDQHDQAVLRRNHSPESASRTRGAPVARRGRLLIGPPSAGPVRPTRPARGRRPRRRPRAAPGNR